MFRPAIRPAREFAAEVREQADEFTAGPRDPDADAQPESRRGRRLLWWDGLVSNFSESFVLNFTGPFALALGATTGQIGWLSALVNLASALALFPGARLVERTGQRKRIVVWTGGGVARLLLLVIALVPVFIQGTAAIYAFIALVALRAFFSQLGFPAWSAMLADLVPAGIRGRYFASRNIGLAVAALIAAPLAGWLADQLGLPRGYQVSFFLAGLIGFGATAIFARIPDHPLPPVSQATTEKPEGIRSILRTHPRFAGFTAVAFLWNLSLMVAGPFFSVYLVRDLGATPHPDRPAGGELQRDEYRRPAGMGAAERPPQCGVGHAHHRLHDPGRPAALVHRAQPLVSAGGGSPLRVCLGRVWPVQLQSLVEPDAACSARTLHRDLSGLRLQFSVHRAAAGQCAGRCPGHPAALLDFSRRPRDRLVPISAHGARRSRIGIGFATAAGLC